MSLAVKDTQDTLKQDSKLMSEGHMHITLQKFETGKAVINLHHHSFHHKPLKLLNF